MPIISSNIFLQYSGQPASGRHSKAGRRLDTRKSERKSQRRYSINSTIVSMPDGTGNTTPQYVPQYEGKRDPTVH